MEYKVEIEGHTIELRGSSTGSIDPWTLEYAIKKDVALWCTSDLGLFALVDDDHILKLRGCTTVEFYDIVQDDGFQTWADVEDWLNKNIERDFGSLEESKKDIDERKRKDDEYKAMAPEEKEEYKREWKRKHDERIAKIREQAKNNK